MLWSSSRSIEDFLVLIYLVLYVFNFLDIPKFLHCVNFGFGSLYFCFGLGYFVNALVIHITVSDLLCFCTWLIPLWLLGYFYPCMDHLCFLYYFLMWMWMLVSISVLSSFWCCQRGRESCKVQGIFFCNPFWK